MTYKVTKFGKRGIHVILSKKEFHEGDSVIVDGNAKKSNRSAVSPLADRAGATPAVAICKHFRELGSICKVKFVVMNCDGSKDKCSCNQYCPFDRALKGDEMNL